MTTRHEGMTWLKSLKGERATRYDVREIGIFGSGARGEDDNQSDSNLLAESGSRADLITDIGLGQYLYDTFGTEIDLVAKGGLRSDVRDKVMQDLVLAGERSRLVEHSSEDLKERA